MSSHITLVLGGARSGKSRYAEALVTSSRPAPWVYVATAEALDPEMVERIARHRSDRTLGWTTVEEPLDLTGVLERYAVPGATVLVDCLTMWLCNLLGAGMDVEWATMALESTLAAVPGNVVLVTNELGLGIVPDNPMARAFRDHAGRLNQKVAERASKVVLMVAGLPLVVKG
jgi:adenosylcobinamide kinase/adenosylcobinamide-phosphate guanylyltransferase